MKTSQDFEKYHAENPAVYDAMVRYARQWKSAGNDLLGMSVLVGRIRWWAGTVQVPSTEFKINDHFGPYYARLIMAQERDLSGLFNTRASEADVWIDYYLGKQEAA